MRNHKDTSMDRNLKDLSKIEKALLERELSLIKDSLAKIGNDLIAVFSKYGTIRAQCGKELADYIRGGIVEGNDHYYAGYSSSITINQKTADIPEQVRLAILDWAVTDFFEKYDEVRAAVDEIEQR